MDSHDIGRNRGGIESVMSKVTMPVCVMGIDSDVLYPITEQKELYGLLKNSAKKSFVEVNSDAGHDGFLLEQEQVGSAIKTFLDLID